jgi:transposase
VCISLRLWPAVSDVDGATEMAILRAIAAGERDPRQLARLRDRGCRKSEEEIAEQLNGHWREDHLFSLRRSLQMYDAIEQRIADYDGEVLRLLNSMAPEQRRPQSAPALKNQPKMRSLRKRGQEPARQALYRMSGVDMTQIDAVGVETVQIVLSE